MKVNIVSKQKNALLHREEITFEVNKAKITPSRKELREQIAAMCNADSELVIVDDIKHSFGTDYVSGKSRVYDNKESLSKIELAYKVKRHTGKAEETKEETSKPEAVAEEKADGKKDDAKSAEDKKGELKPKGKKEDNKEEKAEGKK